MSKPIEIRSATDQQGSQNLDFENPAAADSQHDQDAAAQAFPTNASGATAKTLFVAKAEAVGGGVCCPPHRLRFRATKAADFLHRLAIAEEQMGGWAGSSPGCTGQGTCCCSESCGAHTRHARRGGRTAGPPSKAWGCHRQLGT